MLTIKTLIEHIATRVRISLNDDSINLSIPPYMQDPITYGKLYQFFAFYALPGNEVSSFSFNQSSLAGSYFRGRCEVDHCLIFKTDIRGDELKKRNDHIMINGEDVALRADEIIQIRDSFLLKTLIHSHSHDPKNPEILRVANSISLFYANIHGASLNGCILEPFATADLSILSTCVLGAFSYVQAGEQDGLRIAPGHIWIKNGDIFEFSYRHSTHVLEKYIGYTGTGRPTGILTENNHSHEEAFDPLFSLEASSPPVVLASGASISPYAALCGECIIAENVLVAQRTLLEDVNLGPGSNAQENCCIKNSHYAGFDITAHGATVIGCHLEEYVFIGFNSFIRADKGAVITVGEGSIIMPHTIIDVVEDVNIPAGTLVFGFLESAADLATKSISLKKLCTLEGEFSLESLTFTGNGKAFVEGFKDRIQHILEANGAFFDGKDMDKKGHAQKERFAGFGILKPYPDGARKGMYPSISIAPCFPGEV